MTKETSSPDYSGGGGDDWGWYPPEGGSGGGGTVCPGCSWGDTNPCEEQDPNQPQFPCDQDWQPVINEVREPYHVDEYDTVGVGNGLRNVYPCIASLISDSLANMNGVAQSLAFNAYGDSLYLHLTFDTSTVYTQQGQGAAATTPDTTIFIDPNGYTHFFVNIGLNGYYLRNASRDYTISTIIHESLHALFILRWAQYQIWLNTNPHLGTIDSNYIKNHYGIYWEYMTGQQPTASQQHILMANQFIDQFVDIGRVFYNPSAPTAIRDTMLTLMGRGALRESSMWELLPSMGIDTCKINIREKIALDCLIGSYNTSSCGSFTTHYIDSLFLTPPCH